ncbi:MAG: hypothetical protein J5649_08960 [Lachnospiraceae bacterium]|nr:hypothetical protein [Lachnospiraceae bacterium]
MEQGANNNIIAECKRKKKDKEPAVFYADHMEYKGESYKYGEMDTVSVYASAMRYGILLENFSGFIKMTFRDGRKLKWKINGNAFLGFGKNKLKRDYFANMYEACMLTFFKARAAEYLETIRNGGTVTIANVTVGANEISGKSGLKKATVPMPDVGGSEISSCFVRILAQDQTHTVVNPIASKFDNAVVLIPIVNALIGGNQ